VSLVVVLLARGLAVAHRKKGDKINIMNHRVSSMLKGMLITPLVVTSLCVLVYYFSLSYPESFPRTLAVRLFFVLPPFGALVGGFLAWHCSKLSKIERSQLAGECVGLLGFSLLTFLAWDWLFGAPRDEETKFVKQLLTTFASILAWAVWLKVTKRRQS
jgi:hypothetical protein